MYLLDVIPLTKIPSALPQILSYFSGVNLPAGAIVQIPLGRRQEKSVVVETRAVADFKMAIKQADYELKNINRIISAEPILTPQQIELALFLSQYYFSSPGLFAKMMMPKINQKSKGKNQNDNSKLKNYKSQRLIIVPTISQAENIALKNKSAVLWHSGLKQKQLNKIWWQIKNGTAQTIIGPRSAIFLPFANLKEIFIEDEANPNHKSWDMFPHYRVHEAAQKLAEIFKVSLSLRSVPLSGVRDNKTLIIDLRAEIKEGNFSILSRALQASIKNALAEKKPVILFINRRGAANFVLCRDCGYVAKCANCEAPLAYHLVNGRPALLCHRCGSKDTPPSTCPKCQSWRVKTVGGGTQKAELETKKLFPDTRVARLDSDTASSPKDQQKIIEALLRKEIDILITTQIIFSWLEEIKKAKPGLVVLLFADTLLHLPDFRSGERTFQMIAALKTANTENFMIQTYSPENTVIQRAAQNDWQSFWQEEMETRQVLNYPPFSQIVKLTFRHRDPKKAGQEAKVLAKKLQNVIASPRNTAANKITCNDVEISDALPAFIPKEKGRYAWNIIIKFLLTDHRLPTTAGNEFLLRRNSLLQYVPSNWEIDVDPENLL